MHIDCLLDSILIILNLLRMVIVFWISRRIDWLLGDIAKILGGEKEREKGGEGYHIDKMATAGEPSPE